MKGKGDRDVAKKNYFVGMDIGTTQVRVIVGEPRPNGAVSITGLGVSPSEGLKKGVIVDLDKTIDSIVTAVSEAERMAGHGIESAYVGLKGLNVQLIGNRGMVAVSSDDREICDDDIERVLQASRVMALAQEREIVDIIPQEYIVDGYDGISNPVGMLGVRLEVDATIVTSPATSLRNLVRCINRAGINVNGIILHALANSEVCLTGDEKELGVFLVDIGGGTTETSLFQHGKLQKLSVIPIGGDHITNDLSMGLRTSFFTAERLKLEHGCALSSLVQGDHKVEITTIGSKEKQQISPVEICRYLEPRIQEIFQISREEMIKMGWPQVPPAGVVITGGVSSMPGILEVAKKYYNTAHVRLAECDYVGIQNPVYATSVGLLYYVQRHQPRFYSPDRVKATREGKAGLWQRFKDWLGGLLE